MVGPISCIAWSMRPCYDPQEEEYRLMLFNQYFVYGTGLVNEAAFYRAFACSSPRMAMNFAIKRTERVEAIEFCLWYEPSRAPILRDFSYQTLTILASHSALCPVLDEIFNYTVLGGTRLSDLVTH